MPHLFGLIDNLLRGIGDSSPQRGKVLGGWGVVKRLKNDKAKMGGDKVPFLAFI